MDNINDIITDMRVLAQEIGGDHHSNKESEQLLNTLADRLICINNSIILYASNQYNDMKRLTGSDEKIIYILKKQNISILSEEE